MKQLTIIGAQVNRNLEKLINNNYFFILGLLVVFKVFLIRNSEVLAGLADRLHYARLAENKLWFSANVTADMFIRPPGYPIFIFLSSLLGLPLRLAHEFFYIASLFFLLYALRLLKIPKVICLLFFIVALFHPYTFVYFNDVMSESIYISLMNFIIGLTIMMFVTKRNSALWLQSLILGLIIGFSLITRNESIIMYLYFLSIAAILLIKNFKRLQKKQIIKISKKIILICIIPMLIARSIIFGTVSLNQAFLGLPGLTMAGSPGLKGTVSKLLDIDTNNQLRYIPISKAQLELAYQVSPTLKELKPYIDNFNPKSTTNMLGGNNPNNEIRRGNIGITLLIAAQKHIGDTSTEDINLFFNKINEELKNAFQNNLLPTYNVLIRNPIDPRWDVWLPYLDDSLKKISYNFLFPPKKNLRKSFQDPETLEKSQISIFDRVANRRTAILANANSLNKKLKRYLAESMYGVYLINFLGLLSFIFLFVYYFIQKKHSLLLSNYLAIVTIILGLFLCRILLYSIIDASAWIIEFRYIFPMLPLFSGLSIVNVWVVLNLIINNHSRKVT